MIHVLRAQIRNIKYTQAKTNGADSWYFVAVIASANGAHIASYSSKSLKATKLMRLHKHALHTSITSARIGQVSWCTSAVRRILYLIILRGRKEYTFSTRNLYLVSVWGSKKVKNPGGCSSIVHKISFENVHYDVPET